MEKLKVLELFGGIGAPRKALENILNKDKMKFIDYVEYDQMPVMIYNKLYSNDKQPESVVGYNLKPDVLIHGSPCQDFSVSGKGLGGFLGTETKSSLMWETVRIVREFGNWKPKVIIWENVKGVLQKSRICQHCKTQAKWDIKGTKPCKCGKTKKTNFDNFNLYLDSLTELGYVNHYKVLNSKNFGIPQSRNRVFVVSILETADEFLHFNFDNVKEKEMRPLSEFLEANVDKEYFITQKSMMKAIENGKIKIVDNVVSTITTKQMRWNNAGVIKIPFSTFQQENYCHITFLENKTLPTITAVGANSRIKIFIPKKYDDIPVFEIEKKYYNLRVITPIEAWKLMGFTGDDYKKIKGMPKAIKYKVAGNSIVVDVLEAIFNQLLNT